jgi:hypothetical protein
VLDRLNLSSQPEKEFLSPTVGKSARFSGGGGGGTSKEHSHCVH